MCSTLSRYIRNLPMKIVMNVGPQCLVPGLLNTHVLDKTQCLQIISRFLSVELYTGYITLFKIGEEITLLTAYCISSF